MMTFVTLGADTTAIALRATFDFLIRHPKYMNRLQSEIDQYYNSKNLTAPITYSQALELPFLQAVIKEAGRLHPSIMYQLPRYAPPEGITIEGKFLPAGTEIGISPLSMNRDTRIFGADANEFRPERWIENAEKARYMDSMLTTVHLKFSLSNNTLVRIRIENMYWTKYCFVRME
jgi:cytochrome P450